MKRFAIRVDPVWRPFVLVGGAVRSNAYVDVTPEAVTFHFGYLFNHTEDRNDITSVKKRNWPLWMGIGWRTNLRGLVGIVGSYNGVVEVEFEGETPAWGFIKLNRIAVSLEDPDGFIAMLNAPRDDVGADEQPVQKATPRSRNGKTRSRRTTTRRKTTDA